MGQVVTHEVRTISQVAVKLVAFGECIMDGGIEGAGGNQRAELRDRLIEIHLFRDFRRSPNVFRLKREIDIDWMPRLGVSSGDFPDALGEPFHRFKRCVIGERS